MIRETLNRQTAIVRRHLVALALTLLALILLVSCGAPADDPEGQPSPLSAPEVTQLELPELTLVGGAQDLWPFEYGFDATRETIHSFHGEPGSRDVVPVRGEGQGVAAGIVESWEYDGLGFSFFVDPDQDLEFLLAVRITTSSIELGAGVSLGMEIEDLLDILGEPAVENDGNLVYFYVANTIEIEFSDDRVESVTLSRAMP